LAGVQSVLGTDDGERAGAHVAGEERLVLSAAIDCSMLATIAACSSCDGSVSATDSTAGTIGSMKPLSSPGKVVPFVTTSIAAFTAPQSSCPSTTTSGLSSTSVAYSILPTIGAAAAVLPATRTTKSCPRFWSNRSCGGSDHGERAVEHLHLVVLAAVRLDAVGDGLTSRRQSGGRSVGVAASSCVASARPRSNVNASRAAAQLS
jgi:hypothetical protein